MFPFTETLFSSLLAMLCAQYFLPVLFALLGKAYTVSVFDTPWVLVIFLGLVGCILLGLFFSIGWAQYRLNKQTIQGQPIEANRVKRGLANALQAIQIIVFLVITGFMLTVFAQVNYATHKPLGFNKENLLTIRFNYKGVPAFDAYAQLLLSHPEFVNTGGAWWIPPNNSNLILTLKSPKDPLKKVSVEGMFISEGFTKTMEFELIHGEQLSGFANGIWLNETAAKQLDVMDRVGQDLDFGTLRGVVKDFHLHSAHKGIDAVMMVKADYYEPKEMVVRYTGHNDGHLVGIIQKEWENAGGQGSAQVTFMEDKLKALYEKEYQLAKVVGGAAALSIFLALIGLLGINLQQSRKRVKEIAIRKVNGASEFNIIHLINKGLLWNLLLSFVLSIPIIYYISNAWLNTYAYRIGFPIHVMFLPFIFTVLIISLSLSWHAMKAARSNPVEALRYE
jgi:putative ABC transport system permease protein